MKWEDEVKPRIDAEGHQVWGDDEFRAALGYIGRRLGLRGTYHLVVDVLRAFDRCMDTKPEDAAVLLQRLQYVLEHAEPARRSVNRLAAELCALEEDWGRTIQKRSQKGSKNGGGA